MGISQDQRFGELFGLKLLSSPRGPERLTANVNGTAYEFDHWFFKFEAVGAETLLEIEAANGSRHPLLSSAKLGKGRLYCVPFPLLSDHGKQAAPRPLLDDIFEKVLPLSERLLASDAPATVEVVLRRQGNRRIVHLVNMAPGEREILRADRRNYPLIHSLPPVPPCRVSVRLTERPSGVRLEPEGKPVEDCRHEDGRLTVDVPGFAVHRMVVIE
ncbi:MAG: hypothetical protein GXY83_32385 [Rhodopirellula sp.]|nr:hypothetical protein [Rhodopirellula sp.]